MARASRGLQLAFLAIMGPVSVLACADEPRARKRDGAVPTSGYEYIVVGSGAGGGPLAVRLARAGHRVLLLEAGADVGGSLDYEVPARHAISTESPEMAWWYFVSHHRDSALDREDSKWTEQGILYPRGSALGGSTAVNAMVTVLPPPSDWNRLAELAEEPAYRARAMTPLYDRVLEWLPVELPDATLGMDDDALVDMLRSAAEVHARADRTTDGAGIALSTAELTGLLTRDVNEELRHHETSGLYRLPLATERGRRRGTREWIVRTVEEGYPLTVMTNALVTRVVLDEDASRPRATGVEYIEGAAIYRASLREGAPTSAPAQVHASREVILSAGAFNSPQVLMLSGIGDPNELARHGIETRVSRPGVGQNLQDRYEIAVVGELGESLQTVAACRLAGEPEEDPCLRTWQSTHGGGVYSTSGFLATVLRRSSDEVASSDLQIFAAPTDVRGYYPGYARDAVQSQQRFSWIILKAHTQNRDGEVRLRSADPRDPPQIQFHSYDERNPLADPDLRAMVEGVHFVRRVHERMRGAHQSDRIMEIWPGRDMQTDEEIAAWIRRESWGHHASCSNRMGREDDEFAVVDSRFRVIGTEGLRVVDASVFPEIPGTFIALPIFVLSERAADFILEDTR